MVDTEALASAARLLLSCPERARRAVGSLADVHLHVVGHGPTLARLEQRPDPAQLTAAMVRHMRSELPPDDFGLAGGVCPEPVSWRRHGGDRRRHLPPPQTHGNRVDFRHIEKASPSGDYVYRSLGQDGTGPPKGVGTLYVLEALPTDPDEPRAKAKA